ncbi:class D beta-lactamase [Pseudorhodoplanes sinuspersici]|uniref:Beta-lactamase n=1 Tax=Pseudorhodoplanes sinuspersici TaxID=1235591 RepID=A0A1W6ZVD5_9HYPH|nr:class D beta-lactamase [Pseudorhodoplanes sinuspersici]ARQ01389.1 class D beta-lactamase [Pseudorhodoplanes sinuspersici]RKE73072.1 beta-lactamase class D [Pseudorhodoplanes sinuspersici]
MSKIDRRTFVTTLAGAAVCPFVAGASPNFELKADMAARFSEAGTEGVFAVLRVRDNKLLSTDEGRMRQPFIPASTFKVPHALIALETGVVADADKEIIHWDGQVRSIEAWNKDHTLRSAMAVSAVPVYQQIARRIGTERMQKYLDAFQYGNREIGPVIDRFWLDGPLRISALEQIAFFDKLRRGDLPVSKRSLDIAREIIPSEAVSGGHLRSKTGALGIDGTPGEKATLGWLAGYVDRGEDSSVFAMNIDIRSPADLARRMEITKSILGEIGAI